MGVNKFYVYCYLDLNGVPFYVGKGCHNRHLHHLSKSTNLKKGIYYNPRKSRKINKIISEKGRDFFITHCVRKVIISLSEHEALKKEAELILKYGRLDLGTGTLTNLTPGGEFSIGSLPKSQSHREKLSKSLFGHKRSETSKENQSNAIKGKSNPMFGRTHSAATRNKIRERNSKPIFLFGKNYSSITEAAKENNVSRTTIVRWLEKHNALWDAKTIFECYKKLTL